MAEVSKNEGGHVGRPKGGETDLQKMLDTLEADVKPGAFVYVTVKDEQLRDLQYETMIREPEGLTLIMHRSEADFAKLPYDFVASWITLRVHSALDAVGLTAAFSRVLTEAGVSSNVLAGFYHDHILVPADQVETALQALRSLRKS